MPQGADREVQRPKRGGVQDGVPASVLVQDVQLSSDRCGGARCAINTMLVLSCLKLDIIYIQDRVPGFLLVHDATLSFDHLSC